MVPTSFLFTKYGQQMRGRCRKCKCAYFDSDTVADDEGNIGVELEKVDPTDGTKTAVCTSGEDCTETLELYNEDEKACCKCGITLYMSDREILPKVAKGLGWKIYCVHLASCQARIIAPEPIEGETVAAAPLGGTEGVAGVEEESASGNASLVAFNVAAVQGVTTEDAVTEETVAAAPLGGTEGVAGVEEESASGNASLVAFNVAAVGATTEDIPKPAGNPVINTAAVGAAVTAEDDGVTTEDAVMDDVLEPADSCACPQTGTPLVPLGNLWILTSCQLMYV